MRDGEVNADALQARQSGWKSVMLFSCDEIMGKCVMKLAWLGCRCQVEKKAKKKDGRREETPILQT